MGLSIPIRPSHRECWEARRAGMLGPTGDGVIEIVEPYVLILVLSAMAATALGLAAVVTSRPAAFHRPSAERAA